MDKINFSTDQFSHWMEAICSLSEEQFSRKMHLYLGEIKTPYNKQRLTEQLAGFLRKSENIQNLISFLDEFDLQILTAVSLFPRATETLLIDFFSTQYSQSDIYAELLNLEDRLLIYKSKDKFSSTEFIFINPLLKDELAPYFNIKFLLPNPEVTKTLETDEFCLSAEFLASFVSYVNIFGLSVKADGDLKKNELARLQEIFGANDQTFQFLTNAFSNLFILKQTEKGLKINQVRLEQFAQLNQIQQFGLLCATATSHLSREGIKKHSQLLIDCLASIPQTGYTRSSVVRLGFLMSSRLGQTENSAKGRFERLMQKAKEEQNATAVSLAEGSMIDRMIDSAIAFGLLKKIGTTEKKEEVFVSAIDFSDQSKSGPNHQQKKNFLHVNSAYTVTLLPGLNLEDLAQLMTFLQIKKFGVVCEFEITKKSVSFAFDQKFSPQQIYDLLSTYLNYEIPQNIKVSIEDWYSSYSSAMLYKGFVLKVSDSNISVVLNNPRVRKFISEELAPGVYFLDLPLNTDIKMFLAENGIDFMGKVRKPYEENEFLPFPPFMPGKKLSCVEESKDVNIPLKKGANLLNNLKHSLEQMDLNKNQKQSLLYKIEKRLILSEHHLSVTSVRTEIMEVDGMDYAGKIHMIDAAVKNQDLLELKMPNANGSDYFTIIGLPLNLSKQTSDAVVQIKVQPLNQIENFIVSRISHLRRLKF